MGSSYRITAAGATPNLDGRSRLQGPRGTVAEVIYFEIENEQFKASATGTSMPWQGVRSATATPVRIPTVRLW